MGEGCSTVPTKGVSCGEEPLPKLPERDLPVEQDTQRGIGTAQLNRYFEILWVNSLKRVLSNDTTAILTSFLIGQSLKGDISVRFCPPAL